MNFRVKLSAFLLIAGTVLFTSCQKTEIEPMAPSAKVQKPNVVQDANDASRPPVLPIIR
jgi:hypothetical protein